MKFEASKLLTAPIDEVWRSMDDPVVLAKCAPGCRSLEREGEDTYRANLELGVAAVRGRYRARVQITDRKCTAEQGLLHVSVHGDGDNGFLNGQGDVHLEARPQGTLVRYEIDANIGGRLAQVGQRMLGGVAKLLAGQFFDNLEAELQRRLVNLSSEFPPSTGSG